MGILKNISVTPKDMFGSSGNILWQIDSETILNFEFSWSSLHCNGNNMPSEELDAPKSKTSIVYELFSNANWV